MSYTVVFKPSAEREFQTLATAVQARLLPALQGLAAAPRPPGSKKLRARDGYRLRVGDYRILYAVDDRARLVRILALGHRRDIYR